MHYRYVLVGLSHKCAWIVSAFLITLATFFIGENTTTYAQPADETIGVRITPAIIETALIPGKTTTKQLQITNQGNQSLPYVISVEGLLVDNEVVRVPAFQQQFDVRQWVELSESYIILPANEPVDIDIFITPPQDASPGGHYFQLRAQPLVRESTVSNPDNLRAIPELTVPVLTTVAGALKSDLVIEPQPNTFPFDSSGQNRAIRYRLENRGNNHHFARPKLTIRNNKSYIKEVELEPVFLLPGTADYITYDWQLPDSWGSYVITADIVFDGKTYSDSSYQLWVLPQLEQSLLVIIGLAGAAFIYRYRKTIVPAARTLIEK